MVEKNNKEIVKELKNVIADFKKEEKVIYDMLALYEHLNSGNGINGSIAGTILTENVLKSLESCKLPVSYKFEGGADYVANYLIDKVYEICREYESIPECASLLRKFHGDWGKEEASHCLYQNDKQNKKMFNLIELIAFYSPEWAFKFLVSDIPFSTRINMFADLLQNSDYFDLIWNYRLSGLSKKEEKKINEKKSELYNYFLDGGINGFTINSLVSTLLQRRHFGIFYRLHRSNVFDFNQVYWIISPQDDLFDGKKISTVGRIAATENSVAYIKELYETPDYLNVPFEVRHNNDLLILDSIDLRKKVNLDLLTWPNFKLDEEKARILGYNMYYTQECDLKVYNDIRNDIFDLIIRRAKNKDDLRNLYKLANIFMETSDYSKEFKKKLREEKLLLQQEKERDKSRGFLTMVLKNMVSSLNDQVPANTQINKLVFEKKD